MYSRTSGSDKGAKNGRLIGVASMEREGEDRKTLYGKNRKQKRKWDQDLNMKLRERKYNEEERSTSYIPAKLSTNSPRLVITVE